jgi:hypothetical protein
VTAEDHEDMDLPKVNEELRNFFLPKRQVQPEPEPAVQVSFPHGLTCMLLLALMKTPLHIP